MPTCCSAPRSISAMKGSPATCSENRVQRAHRTHRSRSRSTLAEMLIGLGKVRLRSVNRVSAYPWDRAWFCSGHSPPLSQMGQSSGWLTSRNSMLPCWALSATGEVSWVLIFMPGATSSVQEACGFGMGRPLPPSGTSTRHWRQAPTGSSRGWSQNRGMSTPISSAARITRVPLGTDTSTSSMVTVTRLSRFSSSLCREVVTVTAIPRLLVLVLQLLQLLLLQLLLRLRCHASSSCCSCCYCSGSYPGNCRRTAGKCRKPVVRRQFRRGYGRGGGYGRGSGSCRGPLAEEDRAPLVGEQLPGGGVHRVLELAPEVGDGRGDR